MHAIKGSRQGSPRHSVAPNEENGTMPESADATPLPDGWEQRLLAEANLERSFAELRELKHFWAAAWRGRIRSAQLRFDAAWNYFDKAYTAASVMEETIPNMVRQFLLNIWCFENALVEAPIGDTVTEVPEAWIPDLPAEILAERPEVSLVILRRKATEALLRLHLGQHNDAAEIYRELLEAPRNAGDDDTPLWHLGLAASEHSLGFPDRARRAFEDAGLAISACESTLPRGRSAATLAGMLEHLGEKDEATGWRSFIERLQCPAETKKLFLRRADHVLMRCKEAARPLVM